MKCLRCGEELPEGLYFCPFCGASLTDDDTENEAKTPAGAEAGADDRVKESEEPASGPIAPAPPEFVFPVRETRPQEQTRFVFRDMEDDPVEEESGFDPYARSARRAEQVRMDRQPSGGAAVHTPNGPTINVMVPAAEAALPAEYKPISMWGYVGYSLLFALPIAGIILAIVYSFGGTQNVNLRNYARSFFVLFLIGIGISVFMFVIALITGIAIRYW